MKETRLTIVIDPETKRQAKIKAAIESKTLRRVVIDLLKEWVGEGEIK